MCTIASDCEGNEVGKHWIVGEVFCEWCWHKCECDLIAKVRADTLKRVESQIVLCSSQAMRNYQQSTSAFNQGEIHAYNVCEKIIDSLRGES